MKLHFGARLSCYRCLPRTCYVLREKRTILGFGWIFASKQRVYTNYRQPCLVRDIDSVNFFNLWHCIYTIGLNRI